MDRRSFLRGAAVTAGVAGVAALGGSLWRSAFAAPAQPGPSPYGPLLPPDANGVALPQGFASRVVARSRQAVGGSGYPWHDAPDGGACFADGTGWIYVSNSEIDDVGGASAIRFGPDGAVLDGYRILGGTSQNCAGGRTPWNTWLSCEEHDGGYVYETDPYGVNPAVQRPAMGRFTHEAAAVDPDRRCIYLTEDMGDGCLYRFTPTIWPDLSGGVLDVLCAPKKQVTGPVTWSRVPDPLGVDKPTRRQVRAAKAFRSGEGCHYANGICYFTTKDDNAVWALHAATDVLDLVYTEGDAGPDAPLSGVDNITSSSSGDLFVAEDGGNMEICIITPAGIVAPFLRIDGQSASEITGPAFTPDSRRLYFSSQRGTTGSDDGGITYEVTGPFRT